MKHAIFYGVALSIASCLFTSVAADESALFGWGRNDQNESTIPSAYRSEKIIQVSAGKEHSLGLREGGTVVAWGNNSKNQTAIPQEYLTNVSAVAAGHYHSAALKSDGSSIGIWGGVNTGRFYPAVNTKFTAIAAGLSFTMALQSDGSVVVWGDIAGRNLSTPTQVSNIIKIAAGEAHCAALRSDGTVFVWGDNSFNQVGGKPSDLSTVIAIAAGYHHTLALKADGTVIAWGKNNKNQSTVPSELFQVIGIAAGGTHSVALKSNGSIIVWGNTDNGQNKIPAALSQIIGIAAGETHTIALSFDGGIYSWGFNGNNRLRAPDECSRIIALSSKNQHNLALRSNGTVFAWGDPNSGVNDVPEDLTDVTAIAAGGWHNLALKSDGSVVAWGGDDFGQSTVPNEASSNVIAIAAGEYFSMALKSNNTVVTWGRNDYKQLEIPQDQNNNIIAIAAGHFHGLALKSTTINNRTTNTVLAWGRTDFGICTVPSTLSNPTAIAAGVYHSIALNSDGKVIAWGKNLQHQCDVPITLNNVVGILAGGYHNIAIRKNRTYTGWGYNSHSQLTFPRDFGNPYIFAAGGFHSLAYSQTNQQPIADAGKNRHSRTMLELITLNGLESSDPDGTIKSYSWSFVIKPEASIATLQNPTSSTPSFTIDKAGTYVIQLLVTDNKDKVSNPDFVRITTNINGVPRVDAGLDKVYYSIKVPIPLDGSATRDDDNELTYHWEVVSSPASSKVTIAQPKSRSTYFTTDQFGDYRFKLTVTDPWNDFASDVVDIKIKPFLIKSSSTEGGSISPAEEKEASEGDVLVYELKALSQYKLNHLLVNGKKISINGSKYEHTVTGDATILAVFTKTSHTVTPSVIGSGTIDPSEAREVIDGGSIVFTFEASTNNKLKKVLIDGEEHYPNGNKIIIPNITKDINVIFVFKRFYTVTPLLDGLGTITPSQAQSVFEGEDTSFTYEPPLNSTYKLKKIIINGTESAPTSNTVRLKAVAADINLTFVAKRQFTITTTIVGSGTVSRSPITTLFEGEPFEITFLPVTHHKTLKVLVDNKEVAFNGDTYVIHSVSSDHTIEVTFTPIEWKINSSVNLPNKGTIEPAGEFVVSDGSSITFKYEPKNPKKFEIDYLEVNNVKIYNTNGRYTIPDITKDYEVKAYFIKK